MVHLSADQVARLYFLNVPDREGANTPARVQLEFLDADGNGLLLAEPEVVMPGRSTSLDLIGEALDFPPDVSQVGVRAVVRILDAQTRGIATLELRDSAATSRVVLFDPRVLHLTRRSEAYCLGPLGLQPIERATLNVVNVGQVGAPRDALTVEMAINAVANYDPIVEKTVILEYGQSTSLEVEHYDGGIFGTVRFIAGQSRAAATATLEIYHKQYQRTITVLPPGLCRGLSDGGGNGGGGYVNGGK
jgi:hypothetical protein